MSNFQKKLQLDRSEVMIVMGLVVLMCGLMFTVGALIGYGARPQGLAQSHEETAHGEMVAQGKGEGHSRGPASVGEGKKVEAGSEIKKAFRDSKQRALVEMTLKEGSQANKPKSVADAEAHFAATAEWNRKPSSVEEISPDEPKEEVADRKPAAAQPANTDLFERKPAALERFSPTPGTFTVHIASYPTEDESQAKVSQLRKSGYNDAYYQKIPWKNGESWYRVGVGSFPSTVWAQKAGTKIVRRKLAPDFVVRQVN